MGSICTSPENTTHDNGLASSSISDETQLESKDVNIKDFNIEKVIGRGSFGKVFMVKKKGGSNKYYAMKVLKKEAIEARNQRQHTQSEREIMEKVNSPYIVALHYAFQNPDRLYFIMDFCNGGELFYHLRKEIRFSEKRTKFYAAEITLALEALHKAGIIYRDLKPENVLLDQDGHIKITDFGLSKQGLEKVGKKAFTFCGTPEYLAPEIIKRTGHEKSVDWWSLGALIYEMLSGRPPFYSKNRNQMLKNIIEKPAEMKPYFSEEAKSLLRGLLNHNPVKRLGAGVPDSEDLKQHPFFESIDWRKLERRQIAPPVKPKVRGADDYKNFDPMFLKEDPKETPVVSELQYEQKKHNYYDGFTYVPEDSSTQLLHK